MTTFHRLLHAFIFVFLKTFYVLSQKTGYKNGSKAGVVRVPRDIQRKFYTVSANKEE